MATEATPATKGRTNPLLLIVFAVLAVAFVAMKMFSGPASAPTVTTAAPNRTQGAANGAEIDPKELDVRVEELTKPAPGLADASRNPFGFYVAPPPPPAPAPPQPKVTPKPMDTGAPTPVGPPQPPPPPPISDFIKFIGIAETERGKIGAISVVDRQTRECKATFPGREGEVVEGRFRVVRIGIESAVLEFVDGTGRATLPLNGQACVK